jgi:electron transport complex protein RnfD
MDNKLLVSYAPHTRDEESVRTIMLDVIIALMPALIVGTYYFGFRAFFVTLVSAASCMAFETIWNFIIKKKNTAGDLSSAVTGILLAFCLPPQIPIWMVIIGDAFAIIVVKCFFGGLGQNIVNPALCARAFMMASWPVEMTYFTMGTDATSGATALALYKSGEGGFPQFFDLFFGNQLGCIGEGAAVFLLIGGIYLLSRKVITLTIPVTYLLTVGIRGFIFSPYGFFHGDFLFSIVTGGVMLAGIFMATDYTTSPITKKGQFIYALLAGFITVIIRTYGGYPEGVTYAILLANIATGLIDKFCMPKKFGYVKEKK